MNGRRPESSRPESSTLEDRLAGLAMAARKDPFSRDCEKGSILFSRFIYFSLLITVWARRSSPSKTLLIFFSPPINVWVRPVEPVKNLTHTAYLVVTAYQCL